MTTWRYWPLVALALLALLTLPEEPSFWVQYKWYITCIISLCVFGVLLIHILLIERRRAEEVLRESKERYRELVETTHAVPWEADAKTFQFTYVGPQADELLGYPVEEWHTKDFWRSHLHPDDRQRTVESSLEATARGEVMEIEYRMLAVDGSPVWIHDWVTVLRKNGRPDRLRGVMLNVTARKRAEEEAQRHRDELAHVARVATMGELTASIAHEIYQPLGAILTNARVAHRLLEGEEPDIAEAQGALNDIVEDGERASEILKRVRAWVRRKEMTRIPLDINEVIKEIVKLVWNDLSKKGISADLQLADHLPLVTGDRISLQQVILNLLRNAAEASSANGTGRKKVEVRSSLQDPKTVMVAVKDNGIGIDPQNLKRIFDAFFTTKENGMGMGLKISRSIIEAHDGKLWAAQNGDRGATFHFTLPVAASGNDVGSEKHD
jgi:PAS domain S-box-containing protein